MSTRLTTRDIEIEAYDRQRNARTQMLGAVRSLRTPPPDDTVLRTETRHPADGRIVFLSEDEAAIAAEWQRRSDRAIAEIRAEHERMRRKMEGRR